MSNYLIFTKSNLGENGNKPIHISFTGSGFGSTSSSRHRLSWKEIMSNFMNDLHNESSNKRIFDLGLEKLNMYIRTKFSMLQNVKKFE